MGVWSGWYRWLRRILAGQIVDDVGDSGWLLTLLRTSCGTPRLVPLSRQPALAPTLSVSLDLPFVATYGAVDPWAALADGTRRAIFKRLGSGPMAVGELADGLPVSRPAVSQHLKVLKCAGLVRDRAIGTRRVYRVDPKGVEALRTELDVFWSSALDAYKLIADEEGHEK
jgi:DNA-binding transcriptional ArsR family regulator